MNKTEKKLKWYILNITKGQESCENMEPEDAVKLTKVLVESDKLTPELIKSIWSGLREKHTSVIRDDWFTFETKYGDKQRKFTTGIFGYIITQEYFDDELEKYMDILENLGVDLLKTFEYDGNVISEYLLYLAESDDTMLPWYLYQLIARDDIVRLEENINFLEGIINEFNSGIAESLISFMKFIIKQNESKDDKKINPNNVNTVQAPAPAPAPAGDANNESVVSTLTQKISECNSLVAAFEGFIEALEPEEIENHSDEIEIVNQLIESFKK